MAAIEPVNCATGDAPLCPACGEELADCAGHGPNPVYPYDHPED